MSFLSKMKNFVTGGGAKVTVEVADSISRGSTLQVRVTAVIGDNDLNAENVTLKVSATEKVSLKGVEVADRHDDDDGTERKTVSHSEQTFGREKSVASAQTLSANETYTWDAEIEIPNDVLPTYRGRNAKHRWNVLAALEVRGNDPDSGWVDFDVT